MRVNKDTPRPALVTVGEFFLDLIFFDLKRLPILGEELKTDNFTFSFGGGAAITAVAAARLGRPASLVTAWGNSPLDQFARRLLTDAGVEHGWSKRVTGSSSGLTVAVSTRSDRYFLTCPGANREVEGYLLSKTTRRRLVSAGHVHFALTPSRWEPFVSLVCHLREADVTTSWDLGWDPGAAEEAGFRDLRQAVDVLFLNEMEAIRYARAADVAEAVARLGAETRTLAIKLGQKGAVAVEQGGRPVESTPPKVQVLESTGAGDAFDGGFLHAWMAKAPLKDCLRAGNICGALSTRAPGGISALPSRTEFLSRVDRSGARHRFSTGSESKERNL